MEKYTAIYTDSWMSGSHMHTLTKMMRFQTNEGEDIYDAMTRLGIESTVFLFTGWPPLQGENESDIVASKY